MRNTGQHLSRIEALARPDKWFLGGLDGVVWAPPFPRWLHRPGFWDAAHLLQYEVGPGFSVALLDGAGAEIPLSEGHTGAARGGDARPAAPGRDSARSAGRNWRPGTLVAGWRTGEGALVVETRQVLPGGILESAWALPPGSAAGFLVAFTAQPAASVSGMQPSSGGVRWIRRLADRAGQELSVAMEICGSGAPAWRRILPSEGGAHPDWTASPFAEGGTGDIQGAGGVPAPPAAARNGWIWMAVAFPVPTPDQGPLSLRLRLDPRLSGSPCRETAAPASRLTWESFFAGFPAFTCADPRLERTFDYRLHGLGLNRIEGRSGNVRHPCIAEGIEYFHVPISYSAQCHMMEMRWRAGGREAWGSLLNFLDNQKEDGSLHGRLYPNHLEGTDFYHANWGDALLAVHAMHPDPAALTRCYDGLSRYARWLNRSRDPEGSGMFTVVNHFETGQEYMSRYLAVDPEADVRGWEPRLRLKGIDVTVYAHQLFRALAMLAGRVGRSGDASDWRALETRCKSAIMERMWCPEARFFTDVDGRTFERTGVKAAVGFYPMLTGRVDALRLDALMDHLENPRTFGTPFPVPSSSVDDPRFSAEGIWRGKRRNCPWNGRVWPMTTSHVIEGLLRCWRRGNRRAGELAAERLIRFVHLMFTDGDPRRPNCFEHYNPYTGRACHFRGIDDYQHSWVVDLLARGMAGLHLDEEGVEVWPLPHGLSRLRLGPVRVRGRSITVELDDARVCLAVDGARHEGTRERPLRLGWETLDEGREGRRR